MCGVVGYFTHKVPSPEAVELSAELINQSRIRGLHSNGYTAIINGEKKTKKWLGGADTLRLRIELADASAFIFHHRYSTSGDYSEMANNQPIDIGSYSVVANSVLSMKQKVEYEKEFGVSCSSSNDTEIFARMLEQGRDVESFLSKTKGSFAGLYIHGDEVSCIRNKKRPLWWFRLKGDIWVASTADIVRRAFSVLKISGVEISTVPMCKIVRLSEYAGL